MTAAEQGAMTGTDQPGPAAGPDQPGLAAEPDQPVPPNEHGAVAEPGAAGEPMPAPPRRSWRPLALLVTGQLVAGVLAGLAWWAWSPRTVSYLLSGGAGKPPLVIPDETESQIAGDGRFVLLSLGLGLVFGLLAWRLRALRGPVVLVTLAGSGLLSSVLGRTVGELLPSGNPARRLNAAFAPQLSLHALPALAVQAFFAVLVYTSLVGLAADPDLHDR